MLYEKYIWLSNTLYYSVLLHILTLLVKALLSLHIPNQISAKIHIIILRLLRLYIILLRASRFRGSILFSPVFYHIQVDIRQPLFLYLTTKTSNVNLQENLSSKTQSRLSSVTAYGSSQNFFFLKLWKFGIDAQSHSFFL